MAKTESTQNLESRLTEQIERANAAYASGTPYLTDEAYHVLWCQLRTLNPHASVLYHTSKDPTLQPGSIRHRRPILGTQKAFDLADMKLFLTRYGQDALLIHPKYDGVGAVLYQTEPNDPQMYKLVLFGDGFIGRDVSRHLSRITFTMPETDQQNVELVIPIAQWDASFGANPRNVVAGWINGTQIPHKDLVHAIPHESGPLQYTLIPPFDEETLTEALLTIYSEWKDLYPIDGLMIKLADADKRLVVTKPDDLYYRWCIAWKPPMQTKWTTVTNVTWDVSRTGRVVPVISYEELNLCGTVNSKVTGNNATWLAHREIVVGSKILVGKAGEIIPKIIQVHNDGSARSDLPLVCPICSSELESSGVDLICTGKNCKAQMIRKLEYFYSPSGVELKSIGPYSIAAMLDHPEVFSVLKDHPWALLDPVSFNLLGPINGILGSKRTQNYLEFLDTLQGKVNEAQFISALGLDGLAYRTAVKMFHMIKGYKSYRNVSGKAVNSFAQGIRLLQQAREELRNFRILDAPMPPKGFYSITGELSQVRNDFIIWLAQHNLQFVNQVSSGTDFLIVGELKTATTTKYKKAQELGIRMVKEEEVGALLKEYTHDSKS